MIFGKYRGKTQAGLNYNLPVAGRLGRQARGHRPQRHRHRLSRSSAAKASPRRPRSDWPDAPEESLMLTGDENIADVKFRVIWQIDPAKPEDFAFNVANPPATVKAVAESAMREIVGQSQIQKILTADRKLIEPACQQLMQKVLDEYHSGVLVLQVLLLSVDPPASVIAAFRDVTAAQQDLQRLGNEAEAYANRVVPEARGAAARILQESEAYREQIVAEARGQASRFDQIYAEYKKAPDDHPPASLHRDDGARARRRRQGDPRRIGRGRRQRSAATCPLPAFSAFRRPQMKTAFSSPRRSARSSR